MTIEKYRENVRLVFYCEDNNVIPNNKYSR